MTTTTPRATPTLRLAHVASGRGRRPRHEHSPAGPTAWAMLPPQLKTIGRRMAEASLAAGAPLPLGDIAAVISARRAVGPLDEWGPGEVTELLRSDLPRWCASRRMTPPPRSAEAIWYLLLAAFDTDGHGELPAPCEELLDLARSTNDHPAGTRRRSRRRARNP